MPSTRDQAGPPQSMSMPLPAENRRAPTRTRQRQNSNWRLSDSLLHPTIEPEDPRVLELGPSSWVQGWSGQSQKHEVSGFWPESWRLEIGVYSSTLPLLSLSPFSSPYPSGLVLLSHPRLPTTPHSYPLPPPIYPPSLLFPDRSPSRPLLVLPSSTPYLLQIPFSKIIPWHTLTCFPLLLFTRPARTRRAPRRGFVAKPFELEHSEKGKNGSICGAPSLAGLSA